MSTSTPTEVYDCNGHSMTMKLDKGRWMSVPFHAINSLNSFVTRRDDIILCSYSRSGTHWLWALLCMTLSGELSISKTKLDAMLELVGCEHFNDQPSPRVINTHLNYCDLPQDIIQKKCKIVLLMRNPKDVALSNYFFLSSLRHLGYNGTLDGFMGMFLEGKVPYGSLLDYVKEWGDVIKSGGPNPIHVVYYEQLKKNFVPTMFKLGEFIGQKRPADFYSSLEEFTSFHDFKSLHEKNSTKEDRSMFKAEEGFIRKGVIGDWKNWFTMAQNEQLEKAIKDNCIGDYFAFEYS